MSKIALSGNASGTGTFTFAAPGTNTDRTLTLPDATGTLARTADIPAAYTNADALSLFNASGSAPVYACRAWVNFNGTGTVAIRASGNVSSITDNGTGDYTVNFTTAMPDANYASVITAGTIGPGYALFLCSPNDQAPTTTSMRFKCVAMAGSTQPISDSASVNVAIFR
jgi:hypothetical protein